MGRCPESRVGCRRSINAPVAAQGSLREVAQYERCRKMQEVGDGAGARAAQRLLLLVPPPPPQRPALPPAAAAPDDGAGLQGDRPGTAPGPAPPPVQAPCAATGPPAPLPAGWNPWDLTAAVRSHVGISDGLTAAAPWLIGAKRRRRVATAT